MLQSVLKPAIWNEIKMHQNWNINTLYIKDSWFDGLPTVHVHVATAGVMARTPICKFRSKYKVDHDHFYFFLARSFWAACCNAMGSRSRQQYYRYQLNCIDSLQSNQPTCLVLLQPVTTPDHGRHSISKGPGDNNNMYIFYEFYIQTSRVWRAHIIVGGNKKRIM